MNAERMEAFAALFLTVVPMIVSGAIYFAVEKIEAKIRKRKGD